MEFSKTLPLDAESGSTVTTSHTELVLTSVPFVDRSQLEIGRFGASFLTCFDVLTRGQMAECAVRSMLVVQVINRTPIVPNLEKFFTLGTPGLVARSGFF